jgi:hypothetical protein
MQVSEVRNCFLAGFWFLAGWAHSSLLHCRLQGHGLCPCASSASSPAAQQCLQAHSVPYLHHPSTTAQPGEATCLQEEMSKAQLDMVYRDFCAHMLIPLNECRRKSLYMPWKCQVGGWAFIVLLQPLCMPELQHGLLDRAALEAAGAPLPQL